MNPVGGGGDERNGSESVDKRISELVHNLEMKTNEIAQLKMELKKQKEQQQNGDDGHQTDGIIDLRNDNNGPNTVIDILYNPETYCDDEKQLMLDVKNDPVLRVDLPQASSQNQQEKNDCSDGEDLTDVLDCILPSSCDWDKQSNSSVSEMSVACLQDRILQMEETHYSTNEELQATLQELTDLQDQLTELQAENEHLTEEKAVLLESLCSQTEKLEDCRAENENLRLLLFEDPNAQQRLSSCDRENKLLELLKRSREEKEMIESQLSETQTSLEIVQNDAQGYREEVSHMQEQCTIIQANADKINVAKRLLEKQLTECRDQIDNLQIEISRTKTQLENERIKVSELHQAREILDKTELDELLDSARKEKDDLEAHAALLSQQVAFSQCEASRLKETVTTLQDELLMVKTNAKKETLDLELYVNQLKGENDKLSNEITTLRDAIHELERKCQRHLEDKRELRATICDLKHKVEEANEKVAATEKRLEATIQEHQNQVQEWKQFQDDLLMTVRVANDFKSEAQEELERLLMENKQLREKVVSLHSDLEKIKVPQKRNVRSASCSENLIPSPIENEMPVSHNRAGWRDSRPLSVKSLIESIECATKQAKAQNSENEKQNVTSDKPVSPTTLNEVNVEGQSLKSKIDERYHDNVKEDNFYTKCTNNKPSPDSKSKRIADIPINGGPQDGEVKHSSPISILTNKIEPLRRSSYSDILDRKDPLSSLVKGGGSKRNALLKWCQSTTVGYKGIDITNFSSSWNDGLAFCALLHPYLGDKIPYDELDSKDKRRNFSIAFKAAESVGIPCNLNINDMITTERPDWQAIMTYVTAIYKHFET